MNFNKLTNLAGPRVGLATLLLKKHSPEIMLLSGISCGVAASVMLAKAHKKSEDRLSSFVEEAEGIRAQFEEINYYYEAIAQDDRLTKEEKEEQLEGYQYYNRKDQFQILAPVYFQFIREAAILYGPPLILGAASILMLVRGHGIMRDRNKALFSSLVVVERAFNTYRDRVKEELGQEGDERFYYGLVEGKKTTVTVDKDGKKHREKSTENMTPETLSPVMYQKIFDRTNPNFKEDPGMNMFYLGVAQQTMQDRLDGHGFVFLNDVYELLGFEKTPEGQVVGWSLAAPGDDFIYFGIDKSWNNNRGDGSLILDFNVNGAVYEYIGLDSLRKDFK